ncbi:MAG: hypothetical protein CL417_08230 [Acidimicrobiaceae bacterium]|nr:hypothetical protein [Acidimicrobiaceae bacterium]|tara:strand:- start:1257 stop:2039 length:783 start_codon:yes stop_codon:yes gene_type:complete
MKFLGLLLIVFITGCQTAGMEYYQAVEKIAIAQSQAQQAKSEALSKIAASGDNSAAGSAVMALALMQSPNMQVIPQQSAALEWSKAVLPVVGSLGAMWISSDAQKTTARHAMTSNLARIEQEGNKTTALYEMLGSNNDNMLNLGLGSYDAINVAGQQSVDLGLGLGLASINSVSGSTDNSAVLDALGNLQFPNYTSNFQSILDAIGGISIPNYDAQLDSILTQVTNSNTVWIAGVNCVNNATSGVIGVGGIGSDLPVCPN